MSPEPIAHLRIPKSARWRSPFRWICRLLPWLGFTAAFLAIAAAPLGLHCSFIERLTHLRFYWLGFLMLLVLWWAFRRRLVRALCAAALLTAGLPGVIRYYRMPDSAVPHTEAKPTLTLTVATWNVRYSNTEWPQAARWLDHCQADVLLLTEVNEDWARELEVPGRRWPWRILDSANGLWLLSRYPLSGSPSGTATGIASPWIDCTAATPAGPVRILALHPPPPRRGRPFAERNDQLLRCARQAATGGDGAAAAAAAVIPVIVLGDLNCTPFSPWFDRMVEAGGLHDSALGYGLTPTWRRLWWRLPIDHILISRNIGVQSRRVEADRLGSDHHPVLAELVIPDG